MKCKKMNITFTALSKTHFPMMLNWLEEPHVKLWWDRDIVYTESLVKEKYTSYVNGYKLKDREKKTIHSYIIYVDNNPIGYIQIYNAYDYIINTLLNGIAKSLGMIDFFIGNTNYLGKNLGVEILKGFDYQDYKNILVDPDMDNIAAIKTYEKAGFKRIKEHVESNELWMLLQI